MNRISMRLAAFAAAVCVLAGPHESVFAQDNWPQWRGPDQNGVSKSVKLPTRWSLESNIVWKTELPSWSGATPIVWGDRVFVTSPSKPEPKFEPEPKPEADEGDQVQRPASRPERGRGGGGRRGAGRFGSGRDPGGQDLMLLCLSRESGEILWERTLGAGNEMHRKGNNASPSPVTDGEHVWVVTGTGVVTALDFDGNTIWRHDLQEDYGAFGHLWGYASSPLLFDGKLIVEVLHGMQTDDPSYILAYDAKTGDLLWRQERETDAPFESPDAYTTPIVVEHDGTAQIVITGGDYVTGHDPETGEEIWRAGGLNPRAAGNYRIVASPLAVDGVIYAPTRVRPLLALRAGGEGDVTDSNFLWKWDQAGSPDVPTPACDGSRFYMVNDAGMITCLDAKTGEVIWGPNRTIAGTVSSSPLLADGKVYFTNEEGVTIVVSAGDEFEILATNELDGTYTLSSPVASGDKMFVRTSTHLYCIGEEPH